MKFTVDIKAMRDAFTTVKGGACRPSRTARPTLATVRIDATADVVTFTATTLDTWTAVTIPATVHAEGVTFVHPADLTPLLKGKGNIAISVEGDTVTVVNGITTTIPVAGTVDEWPNAPTCEGDIHHLDVTAVASVLPAVFTDDYRPELCSVQFEGHTLAATDTYRLHTCTVADTLPSALVPAAPLRAVVKAANKAKASTVDMVVGGRWARFAVGAVTFHAMLTEGDFPRWQQLIPKSAPHTLVVDRPAFDVAVGSLAKASKVDPVKISQAGDMLHLSVGSSTAEVGGTAPFDTGWNPGYLRDLFAGLTTDTVHLVDAMKPGMVQEEEGGRHHVRILMPVRIS